MPNNNSKKYFSPIAEELTTLRLHPKLLANLKELEQLTGLIYQEFPELNGLCHCGAIDENKELLILYVNSNGAFYLVNNLAPLILDYLMLKGAKINQILTKTRPNQKIKTQIENKLTALQKQSLKKLALAINRPDLIVQER